MRAVFRGSHFLCHLIKEVLNQRWLQELLNQCYLMHIAMVPVATLILLPDFLAKHVVHRVLARAVSIQILQHESPLTFVLLLDVCLALLFVVADVVGHGIPVHAVLLFIGAVPDVLYLLPQLHFYGRFSKALTSLTALATTPLCHFATFRRWQMWEGWRERRVI